MSEKTVSILWSQKKSLRNEGLVDAQGMDGYNYTAVSAINARNQRKRNTKTPARARKCKVFDLLESELERWADPDNDYRHSFKEVAGPDDFGSKIDTSKLMDLPVKTDNLTTLRGMAVKAGMSKDVAAQYKGPSGRKVLFDKLTK